MTVVLGVNAYHADSSACILMDGELIAAAEEERFRRIKHWAGFPKEAITYCLNEASVSLADVDYVATNRDPNANFWRKVGFTLTQRPSPKLVASRIRNRGSWRSVGDDFSEAFPSDNFRAEVSNIEHHTAHLLSAFNASPFPEAVAISVDGFGDFSSAAWGLGRGSHMQVDGRVHFPYSLGVFYEALTQYLGFPHYGDEYKIMGLAPYGEPIFIDQMRDIVKLEAEGSFSLNLAYFRHHKENVQYSWDNCAPVVGELYSSELEKALGPARNPQDSVTQHHMNVARSVQAMYEEAFFHLLRHAHALYRTDALVLAGGCAMNSVANGKIYSHTPFKRTYVQAAAGDAGGAIGAAYAVWNRLKPDSPASTMEHAYWGPAFDASEVNAALAAAKPRFEAASCLLMEISDEAELCERVAIAIAEGSVVGWFQGRMEWGPRALGNRSIVCDPRRGDMKDILNRKIKRRESFRPFAPSILRAHVGAWFETDDDVPFMTHVFQIRQERRAEIPAVTHVDGSGRLQTVTEAANSRYHKLIESFYSLTGVPLVLNTSFNENEPVVCRPEEAIDCFLRTDMDMLVLGDVVITRPES